MPHYEAIAHVQWELPFPLRLPPELFPIWEPLEGVAFLDPRPAVGDVAWRRASTLIKPSDIGLDTGPSNMCFPEYDYHVTSVLKSGEEVETALLQGGQNGGFSEPRQYTIANLFLCLREKQSYADAETINRAADALANVVDIYRYISMDSFVRALRPEYDTYYTVVSVGALPERMGEVDPIVALRQLGKVRFGSELGVSRMHKV